jgi:DNA-binding MarR family transcriptional regulator
VSSIRDIWLHAHGILRAARKIINAELRPMGLGSTEGNILLHILVQEGLTGQDQLAEQLDIDKAAISRAINALQAKGYIVRRRNPADRRCYELSLTEDARRIAPQIEGIYERIYESALRDIEPRRFDELVDLLGRISENFARHEHEGADGDVTA